MLCPLGQDDIRMPDFNGVEAIERIQREYGDARIIVLTTYTGDVQNRPLQGGVDPRHAIGHGPFAAIVRRVARDTL